jgi:hypothetical protein
MYSARTPILPALPTPENALEAENDNNPFNLRLSPYYFVKTLKSARSSDLASEIFVRLLNTYLELRHENDDPLE